MGECASDDDRRNVNDLEYSNWKIGSDTVSRFLGT